MFGKNKVITIENFISNEDCTELTNWTLTHQMQPYFKPACGRTSTRPSSHGVPFPKKAYEVQEKIISTLNLAGVEFAPFCDGMYSGLARNQEEVFYQLHKDPVYVENTYTLHCNIVTTDSLGGAVYIKNHGVFEMKKGRLVAYPVSEVEHEVQPAKDAGVRNLWVFGFCVPK